MLPPFLLNFFGLMSVSVFDSSFYVRDSILLLLGIV